MSTVKPFQVVKAMYRPEVVLKAAYQFLDRCYIHIGEDGDHWLVYLRCKENGSIENLNEQFENELLLQAVRYVTYQQTKSLRELLLARALATSMIDQKPPLERIEQEENSEKDSLQEILQDWYTRHES